MVILRFDSFKVVTLIYKLSRGVWDPQLALGTGRFVIFYC